MTTQIPRPRISAKQAHRSQPLPIYVSVDEAAAVMSVSTKTIRRRISDGTIPAYQCGRRNIRIRLEDLEAAFQRLPAAHW